MVVIPEGISWMGNTGTETDSPKDEFPYHKVLLNKFEIGKCEVNRVEYARFIDDGGYSQPGFWSSSGWEWRQYARTDSKPPFWDGVDPGWAQQPWDETAPVTFISFFEADAYCKWLSARTESQYRLPTEAEWEKAARWDPINQRARQFPWGNTMQKNCLNWNGDELSGYNRLMPVGSYPCGASYYGALDMAGNVIEWVADLYDADFYTYGNSRWGKAAPDEVREYPFNLLAKYSDFYVLKGGGMNSGQNGVRCAKRYSTWPGDGVGGNFVGFRVARSLAATPTPTTPPPANPGEWVHIPAGAFVMGSSPDKRVDQPGESSEHPQHLVYLDSYDIGKYELTKGEFRDFYETDGYTNPAYWSAEGNKWRIDLGWVVPMYWTCAPLDWGGPWPLPDDHPMIGLCWYEAEAFCNWKNAQEGLQGGERVRLPTEAEWEKAARWVEDRSYANEYPWGDWCGNGIFAQCDYLNTTARIGSHPENVSWYGCYDMSGNVWEWVSDWYDPNYFATGPCGATLFPKCLTAWNNPQGPASPVVYGGGPVQPYKSKRGGGFSQRDNGTYGLRSAGRGVDGGVAFRYWHFGMRLARNGD